MPYHNLYSIRDLNFILIEVERKCDTSLNKVFPEIIFLSNSSSHGSELKTYQQNLSRIYQRQMN